MLWCSLSSLSLSFSLSVRYSMIVVIQRTLLMTQNPKHHLKCNPGPLIPISDCLRCCLVLMVSGSSGPQFCLFLLIPYASFPHSTDAFNMLERSEGLYISVSSAWCSPFWRQLLHTVYPVVLSLHTLRFQVWEPRLIWLSSQMSFQ